jgi:NifB/MoaA-like Fe-S oxidoreductase
MVRQLLDEWEALSVDLPALGPKPATLVCGTLIAPVLAQIAQALTRLTGAGIQVLPVINQFFGPVTTVSGLLTGADVVAALKGQSLGELVFLPRAMFTGRYGAGASPPGVTLDDMSLADLSTQLAVPVEMAGTMTELLAVLA